MSDRRVATADDRDAWWLLERPGPIWWTGETYPFVTLRWSSDANRGKRFPTKAAAETQIDSLSGIKDTPEPFARATEHIWLWRGEEQEYVGYQKRGVPPEGATP